MLRILYGEGVLHQTADVGSLGFMEHVLDSKGCFLSVEKKRSSE